MKQVFNPFLPLDEYVPDGEPHVFGDRVYLYGSHDKEGGHTFCMQDYVVYSAPVKDLTDWRFEGVSYRAEQDPAYPRREYMYAPDVVRGNDGRYYLYYCMAGSYGMGGYTEPISVAVSDSPAGPFSYLGHVRHKDGSVMKRYVCFDPAVMNDEGTIRLYYGTQYDFEERPDFPENPAYLEQEMEMFGRTREEILSYPDSIMGPVMLTLEDDMLTVREEPKHIIPYRVKGTSFEEHPFFEAASMRKFDGKYYFIYSSWQNHELCYAISDYPDKNFTFGGTLVSNGDIGLQGRTEADKLNMTGTTHGSIVCIGGEYYVFYHRLTHKSDYSRQACAEKLTKLSNGHFLQVEITSCGLNGGPLEAYGTYPAVIACNLTNGRMPHGSNSIFRESFPNVANIGSDRFIAEICEGTLIGFKYYDFCGQTELVLTCRMECEANLPVIEGPIRIDERSASSISESGRIRRPGIPSQAPVFEIRLAEEGEAIAYVYPSWNRFEWTDYRVVLPELTGTYPLYLVYHGERNIQLKQITFQ